MVAAWEVLPFDGLGPLRFGMTAVDVEGALGVAPIRFKKGESEEPTLAFNSLGVHAYFDDDGILNFIEVFSPCRVWFRGLELIGSDSATLRSSLAESGFTVRADGQGGCWVDSAGFALFAPNEIVEGISAFIRGYPGSQ